MRNCERRQGIARERHYNSPKLDTNMILNRVFKATNKNKKEREKDRRAFANKVGDTYVQKKEIDEETDKQERER